jgi:hypothetical protein
MNKRSTEKILSVGFFFFCGLVFTYLVFKLISSDSPATPQLAQNQMVSAVTGKNTDQWLLRKDQPLTMDDLKITYRGMVRGEILLDVTLLQLDTQYAYRRTVPEALAHRGVQLGQRFFKITTARSNYLKLVLFPGRTI